MIRTTVLAKLLAVAWVIALVAACGGGDAFTSPSSTSNSPGTSSSGNATTNQFGSISLSLLDGAGTATTTISADSPATLRATVLDADGLPVSGALVTFSSAIDGLVTFNPTTGTALTNASGVASVQVIAGSTTGASILSAAATVSGSAIAAQTGFQVNAPNLSLGALTIGSTTLSSYGTTSLTVTVLDGSGNPYTTTSAEVRFSSTCASAGKTVMPETAKTVNGTVTVSYADNGCAAGSATAVIDALNVLLVGSSAAPRTGTITINPTTAGSIRFVSAEPTTITLKGTGGAGLQETSKVIFKVVDSGGNPVGGMQVDFSLSTSVGGINLSNASMISDQTTGEVYTIVNAGTVATPVRVIAKIAGTALETQSDKLSIGTGIPDQDSVTIAASVHNIEGWSYAGVTTDITMYLADHFNNPVPDGTSVSFTTEGGKIETSCLTVNGECTVVLNSQNIRPSNGRVTVLGYAVGEESFTDLDGDGKVSSAAELIDANGLSTDVPGEAYVDYDEDGTRDANEEPIDFDSDGVFDNAGDGLYNGILCDSGSGQCSGTRTLHVRASDVIIFSGSHARAEFISTDPLVTIVAGATAPDTEIQTIALPVCQNGVPFTPASAIFRVKFYDDRTNVMPANTTISASAGNGTFTSKTSYTVLDSNACHTPGLFGCPATADAMGSYSFSITSDASQNPETLRCSNSKSSGLVTITVTTPKGNETSFSFNVTD